MPSFIVKLKADLENIEKLIPLDDNLWKLDIQSSDGSEVRSGITVRKSELQPLDGSKGEAHFVVKFKGHDRQSYIKIVDMKGVDGTYTADDSGEWKTILALECRGLDVIKWYPEVDFVAVCTNSGNAFVDVDLSSGDWADYDQESDQSVTIMNVETKIE